MLPKKQKVVRVNAETLSRARSLYHDVCAALCKTMLFQDYLSFLIEQGLEHLDGEIKLYQERNKQT